MGSTYPLHHTSPSSLLNMTVVCTPFNFQNQTSVDSFETGTQLSQDPTFFGKLFMQNCICLVFYNAILCCMLECSQNTATFCEIRLKLRIILKIIFHYEIHFSTLAFLLPMLNFISIFSTALTKNLVNINKWIQASFN